jgi:hypothetical protein
VALVVAVGHRARHLRPDKADVVATARELAAQVLPVPVAVRRAGAPRDGVAQREDAKRHAVRQRRAGLVRQ